MTLVGLKLRFPEIAAFVASREREVLLFLAAQLQTNRGLMFDESNASRSAWAPPKLRRGQPLSLTGSLRQSFAPRNDGERPGRGEGSIVRFSGDTITIGTTLAKAPILNFGGVIRAKNKPVLWIPLPDGSPKSANAPSKAAKALVKGAKAAKKTRALERDVKRLRERYSAEGDEEAASELEEKLLSAREQLSRSRKESTGATNGPPIVRGRNGKFYMLAKQVTIPARPMNQWTASDQAELEAALAAKLEQIMQEALQ